MTRWRTPTATSCLRACWHDGRRLMGSLLLGVDGGATKTVALIADASGTVVGAGRAGSSDIHNEVPDVGVGNVESAVRDAAAAAGVDTAELDGCVFCLCGADWPEDTEFYAAALQARLRLPQRPTVMNDAFGALRADTPDGVGVSLVLGTGAAIAARGPGGSTWFSGERMESSGAIEFGRQAYELLIRGEYGSGSAPSFQAAVLAAYQVADVEGLVHEVSRTGGAGRRSLARLAPVVLQAGHDGDPQAGAMVAEQGRVLAGYVRRAAERALLPAVGATVVLTGGLLRHPGNDLFESVAAGLPDFMALRSEREPVYGAVMAAADERDTDLSPDRLIASGPDPGFFHTL